MSIQIVQTRLDQYKPRNQLEEDLDFALLSPSVSFDWNRYLQGLQTELEAFGTIWLATKVAVIWTI
jgi:hypothetical protein